MPYENFRLADDRVKHQGIDRASGYKPGAIPRTQAPEGPNQFYTSHTHTYSDTRILFFAV
jgi:hypothetical protein